MNNIYFDIGIKNSRAFKITLHLLVWLMLFSLPYLLSSRESVNLSMLFERSWIPLFYFVLVFYLNYFFLIDRYFFHRKFLLFGILNVLVIALLIWLNQQFKSQVFIHDNFHRPPAGVPPEKFFIYIDIISLFVPIVFSIALKISEHWIRSEAERKEAANIKLQSELQHLKYQLQPHFFFNSLNNIYSLVDISPVQAKETIHSLGKLMRYLLYDTNAELVSLSSEIEFMQKFIELMKLRTSANTTVQAHFPAITEEIPVAPLLFISLIENAFKHGVLATTPSDIFIDLRVDNGIIRFETRNRIIPKKNSDMSESGIGLKNLEKRLALLYPDTHTFSAGAAGDTFVVILTIACHRPLPNQQHHA